jgi:hypothetical protein
VEGGSLASTPGSAIRESTAIRPDSRALRTTAAAGTVRLTLPNLIDVASSQQEEPTHRAISVDFVGVELPGGEGALMAFEDPDA